MPGATTTTLSWLMKNVYSPQITDSLNREAWGWNKLPKLAPEKPVGNGIYFPVKFGANQAVGPQNAGEALRAAGSPTGEQARVQVKVYTGTIEMEGLTKALTEGNPGSFVNSWDHCVQDVTDSLKKRMNVDWNASGTGLLTLVNGAVTASTSIVCDTTQPLQINENFDVYDATGATRLYANLKVVTNNLFTRTITVTSAVTIEDNAMIYGAGEVADAPADGKGMGGLRRMVDDGTVAASYLGITRASYWQWNATVYAAGSVNISNDLLQQIINRRRIRARKDIGKNMLLMSHCTQNRKYLAIVQPQVRFTKLVLDAGFTALEYNGQPWIMEDVDIPEDCVYMLDPEDLWKFEVRALGFDEEDGSMIKQVVGYDKVMAFLKWYGNVAVRAPFRHAIITGLAVPTI